VSLAILVKSINVGFAQSEDRFVSSVLDNSLWILDKSNRKMMFVRLEKKNELWKSDFFTIPDELSINKCQLYAFGRRGQAVLAFDTSSGTGIVYKIKGDKTIEKCRDVTFPSGSRGFIISSNGNNFWILNKNSNQLTFLRFKSEDKFKDSNPLSVPSVFNLDQCELRSVGEEGEGVFLIDNVSGTAAFFKAKRGGEGGKYAVEYYSVYSE
jgi:hypothetical protein